MVDLIGHKKDKWIQGLEGMEERLMDWIRRYMDQVEYEQKKN